MPNGRHRKTGKTPDPVRLRFHFLGIDQGAAVTSGLASQPLTGDELGALGQYNAEVARGVRHTPEWREQMARLQARCDAQWNMPPTLIAVDE